MRMSREKGARGKCMRNPNCNGKADLQAVHNDHRLEALDVRVLMKELPRELLVIFHRYRGDI